MSSEGLFRLDRVRRHDPEIDAWLSGDPVALFSIARHWYEFIRQCGDDVTETLHDGCPTACIGDAAFAYVNVFKAHVNVGFFRGAMLADPSGLLEGNGKCMRHLKLRLNTPIDEAAIRNLITLAYRDTKSTLRLAEKYT